MSCSSLNEFLRGRFQELDSNIFGISKHLAEINFLPESLSPTRGAGLGREELKGTCPSPMESQLIALTSIQNTMEIQNQAHRELGTPEAAPCLSCLKERMDGETMGLSRRKDQRTSGCGSPSFLTQAGLKALASWELVSLPFCSAQRFDPLEDLGRHRSPGLTSEGLIQQV